MTALRARIAVVDDDDAVRRTLEGILRGRGFDVVSFGSFESARLGLLDATARPELVITDLDLPDGHGLDLVAMLGSGSGSVPAIVLSGHGLEDDFARGFAAGAVDYLAKPFSTHELLARVQRHLTRGTSSPDQKTPRIPFPNPSATTEVSSPLPERGGLALGRYKVEREIGTGAFGRVYLARDGARSEARVALKVLSPGPDEAAEWKVRFIRESYTLSSVKDPHVVAIHDVGALDGRYYFAMEFIEGETLLERLERTGPLEERGAIDATRGLLKAVLALENAGLVHRDMKPANVMLRGGALAAPVLIDFGLAKRPFDRSVTAPNMLLGTLSYMAPEVLSGFDHDIRSDLYGVGLTLRFALTCEEVFPDLEGTKLILTIASKQVAPPNVAISGELMALLMRLIAHDPKDRPQTARDALDALLDVELSSAKRR